jgi:hypothetical protein
LNDKTSYYPLKKTNHPLHDNGYYKIEREILFKPTTKMLFTFIIQYCFEQTAKGISLSERSTRI